MNFFGEKVIVRMYVEEHLSAAQIGNSLNISPSRVRRILENQGVQKRSMSEAIIMLNITKFHKAPFCLKSALSPDENDLKTTGIMLYWGEGAKTGSAVKFANSNPDMIKVFLLFLRKICGVDEMNTKIIF